MAGRLTMVMAGIAIFLAGFTARGLVRIETPAHAQEGSRVFELRTYTAPPGKLDALQARFRDHTRRIFDRHGMTSVGYWTPDDAPLAGHTLVYILEHPSRDAARANWDAFRNDPEWQKVAAESQANGRIVEKVESVFMTATDYSPIK